jgi:hypothetical protein
MTVLERIDLDRLSAEAREVRFWRTVLLVIGGLMYGVGWVTYRICALSWLAGAWMCVAVRQGWRESKKSSLASRARIRAAETRGAG